MEYWILQGKLADKSPAYALPSGIQPNMDCWRIRYYANEVSVGDIAFIWYPNPGRGIYNVSKIVSVPPHSAESERQISILWESFRGYIDPGKFGRLSQYQAILVEDQYLDDLHPPVRVEELKQKGFHDLPVIGMPRLGIYRLEYTVGERLLEYIEQTRGRRQ